MNRTKIYLRLIIFFAILFWCAGFTFTVFSNGSSASIASIPILNIFYNNVCHQDESKLISFNGFNFLVCSRCSGIYFGALLSSVFLLLSFKRNITYRIFSIAAIFLLVDVILNNFLLGSYNKISAFATGLFFGFACLSIFIHQLESHILTKAENGFF
jgi:uncharacterized membrane protein